MRKGLVSAGGISGHCQFPSSTAIAARLTARKASWRQHFLLQAGRRQLLEVPEIERVNSFYRASCRATHQQSVVNFRADPSAACHHVQCLQIVFPAEGYHLKMRQDVIDDDARRFDRMYAWLDRQARECGINLRDRVEAHKS